MKRMFAIILAGFVAAALFVITPASPSPTAVVCPESPQRHAVKVAKFDV